MKLIQYPLILTGILLTISLLTDLSLTMFGPMTADTYYLPLRSVAISDEHREEIEDILIKTHRDLIAHQRRYWFAVHGFALCAVMLSLIATTRIPICKDDASA
ncbi:hypothetical protein SH661x_004523 [Planctomicrobium sp. SH661]|uniref:hypothetical protein n=1 Tax=Planctomicrobium sp. SH661 TaxID=3448124 RepID=UPI003F5C715A